MVCKYIVCRSYIVHRTNNEAHQQLMRGDDFLTSAGALEKADTLFELGQPFLDNCSEALLEQESESIQEAFQICW